MNVINSSNCTSSARQNIKFTACDLSPKHIIGFIEVPKDFKIDNTDALTLESHLQNALKDNDSKKRIHIYQPFEGLEADNSEEGATETLGYGKEIKKQAGVHKWEFRHGVNFGLCRHVRFRKTNNQTRHLIFIDKSGVLFGTRDNKNQLRPIPVQWFQKDLTIDNGAGESTKFILQLSFDASYLNDKPAYLTTADKGINIEDLEGLEDLTLADAGGSSGSTVNLEVFRGCGNSESFYTEYANELADDNNYLVTDNTGSPLVVQVAVVLSNKVVLTLANPVPANNVIDVELADAAILDGNGLVGFEGANSVSIKM